MPRCPWTIHVRAAISNDFFLSHRHRARRATGVDGRLTCVHPCREGAASDVAVRVARHGSGSAAAASYELARKSMRTEYSLSSRLLMRHTYGLALLAAALVTTAARAQDTRALVRYVDSVATAAVAEHRTAGVSVAVVKNGRTVLAKGYGFADLENDVPATAETVFPHRLDHQAVHEPRPS